MFTGPYASTTPAIQRRVVLTNKAPMGAYRGYGQAESNYVREVLVDRLARRLGRDRVELSAAEHLAARGAAVEERQRRDLRQRRLRAVRWSWRSRASATRSPCAAKGAARAGRHVGVGLSFVECTGYRPPRSSAKTGSRFGAYESVTLRMDRAGGIAISTRRVDVRAGHETTFAQMAASLLGLDTGDVAFTAATRRARRTASAASRRAR